MEKHKAIKNNHIKQENKPPMKASKSTDNVHRANRDFPKGVNVSNGEQGKGNQEVEKNGIQANGSQEVEKTKDEKNAENNANTLKNVAKVAEASGNPYAVAAAKAFNAADKISGGKSTEMAGKAMNMANKIAPGGRQIQNLSNKLSESGVGDKVGNAAAAKSGSSGGSSKPSSGKAQSSGGGSMDMFSSIYLILGGFLFFIILFVCIFVDPDELNLGVSSDYQASASAPSETVDTSENIDDFKIFYQTGDTTEFYGSTIEKVGCGPVAMSIVLTNLLGRDVLPSETAKYSGPYLTYENGEVSGTKTTLLTGLANYYNVYNEEISINEESIKNNLNQGRLMILLVGPGTFTTQNHYIVLRGLSSDGTQVAIVDPLSSEKTKTLYNFDTLVNEGISLFSFWV